MFRKLAAIDILFLGHVFVLAEYALGSFGLLSVDILIGTLPLVLARKRVGRLAA